MELPLSPHTDLLISLALLVAGIVVVLSSRGRGGSVTGGTLLLLSIVIGVIGPGREMIALSTALTSAVAGVILVAARERGGSDG